MVKKKTTSGAFLGTGYNISNKCFYWLKKCSCKYKNYRLYYDLYVYDVYRICLRYLLCLSWSQLGPRGLRSLDQFDTVSSNIKRAKTSWTNIT